MLDSHCPMRPHEGSYTFDRDSTHFRYILYYLRNGAHLEAMMLPHEKKYLLELLVEARFYELWGLEDIILQRLKQVTNSDRF